MDEDMPDTVILQSTGATCRARLGWKWVVTREANVTTNPALNLELPGVKAFVEDPPMGAILCLEGPTTSGSTAIPAGAILENAPQGWCLLTEQEAIAKMKALLKSKRIIKNPREFSMMQYWLSQELGAWGAGAIGPPAKELVPVLVETAESLPQRGRPPDRHPARACVQAIVQIEGKSAQPLLKQIRVHWRKHLVELGKAGWGPLVEFIDSAIDQLQE
jgi:hypothetical protein